MYNDINIKIEHSPVTTYDSFYANQIGTDSYIEVDVIPSTVDADDCILVSSSGTIEDAILATTDSTPYVLIDVEGDYYEDWSSMTSTGWDNCEGIYTSTGMTTRILHRELDYTPSDSNTVYVSKAGNDTTGTGDEATPFLTVNEAILHTSAGRTKVMLLDSGTYTEAGFSFSATFDGLYAALGQAPTLSLTMNQDYCDGFTIIDSTNIGGTNDIVQITDNECISLYSTYDSYSHYYFRSFNPQTGTVNSTTSELFSTQGTKLMGFCMTVLADGNICCVGYGWDTGAGNLGYLTFSKTGTVVKAQTTVTNIAGMSVRGACTVDAGVCVTLYTTASGNYQYLVFNPTTGAVVTASTDIDMNTEAGSCSTHYPCTVSGDNVVFFYQYGAGGTNTYAIIRNVVTNAIVVAETLIYASGMTVSRAVMTSSDKIYFSAYRNPGAPPWYTWGFIINKDTLAVEQHYQMNESTSQSSYPIALSDGTLTYRNSSDSTVYLYNRTFYYIGVNTDATIHGVRITKGDNFEYYTRIFDGQSGSLTLKFCEIDGFGDDIDYNLPTIYTGSYPAYTSNTACSDCPAGFSITANASSFTDSTFVWISRGDAIYIDGAGSDIVIDHCDIFDNYSGIELTNNDGSEVVKNCIIHNNANYGIEAETTIILNNTVITDPTTGVTDGSSVIHANPLYVNEGATTPADLDLNIKTRLTNYLVDSPAYGLADDSRNAGAIDVHYLTSQTTWTSMTIEKPKRIDRWIEPVGEIKTEKKDGSVSTYKEAMTEYMTLDYDGMLNADWAKVIQLYASTSSQVRIYEDPDTYPYDYATWNFVYQKLGKGAKHYRLTRTGVQDISLMFARGYEYGS